MPVRVISAMSDLGQTRGVDPHLNQVMESLPVGVWLFDTDGRVVLANPAMRQIWETLLPPWKIWRGSTRDGPPASRSKRANGASRALSGRGDLDR